MPAVRRRGMLVGMAALAKLVNVLTPKRRRAQFSLLTLFLVVTVLCVGLRLVIAPAERQRRAAAAIEALGGRVGYVGYGEPDEEALPKPFLRRWLPRDYFDEVRWVDLHTSKVTDGSVAQLQGLMGLEWLNLHNTPITDAGLPHLDGLARLKLLSLLGTQVTDAGLSHLHGMTGLQSLDLRGTHVTDARLAHLQGLAALESLDLSGTQITDVGLAHLRQALPNCDILPRP